MMIKLFTIKLDNSNTFSTRLIRIKFGILTVPRRYFFVDLVFFFCLVFVMPLCASVYLCLVVTCWESADLLALVCGV